jgi:hypothetical protein
VGLRVESEEQSASQTLVQMRLQFSFCQQLQFSSRPNCSMMRDSPDPLRVGPRPHLASKNYRGQAEYALNGSGLGRGARAILVNLKIGICDRGLAFGSPDKLYRSQNTPESECLLFSNLVAEAPFIRITHQQDLAISIQHDAKDHS